MIPRGLNGMLGVHDAQPAGAHRAVLLRRRNGVGDIAAVEDAVDQLADDSVGIRPVDRYGNSAHVGSSQVRDGTS
jgi:hypothetical protein